MTSRHLCRRLASQFQVASKAGATGRCLAAQASAEGSISQEPPSSTAPAGAESGDDIQESGRISDGWFNPDPVKSSPNCPSSRFSMFWGRVIPSKMHLEHDPPEEDIKPTVEDIVEDISEKRPQIGTIGKHIVGGDNKEEASDKKWDLDPQQKENALEEGTEADEKELEAVDRMPGLFTEKASENLTAEDVNKFYVFDRKFLPEAFPQYYKVEVPDDVPNREPKGGCKSLSSAFKIARSDVILTRKVLYDLMNELSDESKRTGRRLLVHGRPGSGKSVTLAALGEWARRKKWLVMYIPSAIVFGHDLIFTRRQGSQLYDTPTVAKYMLRSVRDSHGEKLETEKQEYDMTAQGVDGSQLGSTLGDLCEIGISALDSTVVVDAAVKLLHEMLFVKRGVPAMVIIDDYNGLYWRTGYGEWLNEKHRRMIGVEETLLGRSMRLLEKDNLEGLHGCVVAAPTFTQGIRRNLWVPLGKGVEKNELDLLNQDEVHRLLCQLWASGSISPVDQSNTQKVMFVTGGNGHELARVAPVLH